MSNRVSTSGREPTRAEKRRQWKAEAERAAAARRRRNALLGVLGSLLVVGLLGALLFVVIRDSDDDDNTAAPEGRNAQSQGFPKLPAGADPALGKKPTVSAGTGTLAELTVTPLVKGTGPATAAGQQITVNYVGVSYRTGAEFDSSWKRQQPFDFQLGTGNVIEGWDKGLVGVTVGSRVQIDIPAAQAYGDNPSGGQPAGPLRFVVDVLAAE